jgi:hypothetical protein
MFKTGPTDRHGTQLTFQLDPDILLAREFVLDELIEWIAEHARNMSFDITDEASGVRTHLGAR